MQTSGRPRAHHRVLSFLYFRPVPFHIVLSVFSKLSKGRPPSLFSPPNFVVHRVDRQRAVARWTGGGNRNWRNAWPGHNRLSVPPLPPPDLRQPSALLRPRARAHTYTSRALSGLSDAIRVGLGLQPPWECPFAK